MILIIIHDEKDKIILVQNVTNLENAQTYKSHFLIHGSKDYTLLIFDNEKGQVIEEVKKSN